MKLKILSYNIHKGFDWKNQNYQLLEMKELITALGADIVFLQEVVGESKKIERSGFIDKQFEFLADGIWQHYSYGKNAIYDHGHHGNLILSKYPIESFENVNLSTNSFEKRGMLVCKINTPQKSLYAACLHLNLLHIGRVSQYKKIEKHVHLKNSKENIPIIIAGDFNDWNKKSSSYFEDNLGMNEVFKTVHGHYAKTFPAGFPLLSLDRVYVKNLKILDSAVISQKATRGVLSDHLPLICEVEFNEE